MPTSDVVFAIFGVADFLLLFLIIAWTAYVSRKESRAADKSKDCEAGK